MSLSILSEPHFGAESSRLSLSGMRSNETLPVVLVDSRDADTRFLLVTLLTLWEYPVLEAHTPKEVGRGNTARRAVLLLDSVYPFEDNLSQISLWRTYEASRHAPIILLSGFGQPYYRLLAMQAGVSDYLVKPIDFDLLRAMLKKRLAQVRQRSFLAE